MIYFVTPAFQRYELTVVCLEQRKRVIDDLAAHGVEARCVVIADDENLDTARSLGFDTVEQNNEWLGRKFNDGIEYAAQNGAEWIVPIGSDSWVDSAYFLSPPDPSVTRTSALYAVVERRRMVTLNVATPKNPAGPHMIHRDRLPAGFRPAADFISRYIDSSTLHGLNGVQWEKRDTHPLQYIGFRGTPHLTKYDRLKRAWGVEEYRDPRTRLAQHYPADLVDRALRAL